MQRSLATTPPDVRPDEGMDAPAEGRACEGSRRLTALLLFPRLDARPGRWLLFLLGVCAFVLVRALELGPI